MHSTVEDANEELELGSFGRGRERKMMSAMLRLHYASSGWVADSPSPSMRATEDAEKGIDSTRAAEK